jgi:hypothetical protein
VVLEVSKEPLAFEYEPLYVGLRIRSKTVQVRLLHRLIAVTGAQKHIVQPVHDLSLTAAGFT